MGLKHSPDQQDLSDTNTLHALLFKASLPKGMYKVVQRADWWAAAADRPQWPMQAIEVSTKTGNPLTLKVANGSQVHFSKQPILIHPLTGEQIDLGQLTETEVADIKDRSLQHHLGLLKALGIQADQPHDMRRTLLALWRFAPEISETEDNGQLGALWQQLPADTRVPDHNIWDHLDLTSAFAGAFAADPQQEVALLTMSLGPVQSFNCCCPQHIRFMGRFAPALPAGVGMYAPAVRTTGAGRRAVPPSARHSAGGFVAARPDAPARRTIRWL